jgi:predicted ATPase
LIDSGDRVASVVGLLQDHRLLTLTGTGGVGKTRMAVELGWSCLEQFDAGVWMVELAPVANEDAVTDTFASALGIRSQEGFTLVDSIVDWFQGRRLLVIIDNCEHVPGPVADLLNVVLPRCPSIKVLATSRQPLGVIGERVHSVAVLPPESDGYDLFVERATAADSSFVPTSIDSEAIVDICRRLDGLPLAMSWPRRECDRWPRSTCWLGSTIASRCCAVERETLSVVMRLCGRQSSGRTNC